jgi:hypothetical protein
MGIKKNVFGPTAADEMNSKSPTLQGILPGGFIIY